MKKIQDKIKNFIYSIWQECKDWKTVALLIVVIAVVYSPVWGGYLLYYIFKWEWCMVMASACLVFWVGPFTPFFPICIAIALFIKKRFINKKSTEQEKVPKRTTNRSSDRLTFCKMFVLFIVGSIAGLIIESTF